MRKGKPHKAGSKYPADAIHADAEYYALTLGADSDGKIWSEGQTGWVGFDPSDNRIEIRKLTQVNAPVMAKYWQEFEQPFTVVNDDETYILWLSNGGHALIKFSILRNHMPWELEERRLVQQGLVGWTAAEELPPAAFKKAPTPKLRMSVIKRDRYRCVICGRSPDDYSDLELHVHHIRPFQHLGLTTEPNLLTLCHTCHNGLDPHFNWELYGKVKQKHACSTVVSARHNARRDEYIAAVKRYRDAIARDVRLLSRGADSRD